MAYTRTRGDIRNVIRRRGEVRSNYVTNADLNEWINESVAELYDLLVSVNKDFYLSSDNVSVVSGTAQYSLPADFYRVLGVDVLESDGDYTNLARFNFAERHIYQDGGTDRRWTRYRVIGSNLELRPTPSWSGTVVLWYIPAPPVVSVGTANEGSSTTDDATTFDYISGWEEYVILDCLMKFAAKEESDGSMFAAQKGAVTQRIKKLAYDIDDGEPDRIRDIELEAQGDFWPDYWTP